MAKTILIIEDDNFLQGLEATKLKKEGYEILTINGEQSVENVHKDIIKALEF